MHSHLPERVPVAALTRVDEIFIFCERIASRIKFVRRHIDYVEEKTDITRWLLLRLKGLPEPGMDRD